jgi:tRNA A37 methylthiotransferase MiaB
MPDTVTKAEKTQRVRVVRAVGERKRLEFYRSQKGMIHECLVEERNKTTGLMKGTTSNYIPVHILESEKMEHLKNQMVNLKISKIARDKVFGEVL